MPRFPARMYCVAVAGLALLLAAPALAQRPTVRDSAGVRIVEHETVRGAPVAFRFATSPFYDVGGVNDDPRLELLGRTPWEEAIRLSDGRLVVAEANELRVFGPDGRYIRTIGRKGQGPGEFPNQIGILCRLRGDSILAIQYGGVRATVFTSEGQYVRMTPLTEYVPRFACTEDGRVLVQAIHTDRDAYRAAGLYRDEAFTFLDTKTGRTQSPPVTTFRVAMFKGAEQRNTTIAIHGERIYVANGETYEIRVHGLDGTLRQILRVAEKPPPFTDADARVMRDSPMATLRPATHYAFDEVRVDALGRIWVEDHVHPTPFPAPTAGDPVREPPPPPIAGWTVFTPDGELLGRVAIPASGKSRFEVVSIGADYALFGVWLEEDLGAIRYRMYRFTRP